MSLPILSSNTIQAMVTPWCTYRGQQAYDNTNLAPLLKNSTQLNGSLNDDFYFIYFVRVF